MYTASKVAAILNAKGIKATVECEMTDVADGCVHLDGCCHVQVNDNYLCLVKCLMNHHYVWLLEDATIEMIVARIKSELKL